MNREEHEKKLNEKIAAFKAKVTDAALHAELDEIVKTEADFGKTSYDKKSGQSKKLLDMMNEIGFDPEKGVLKDFVENVKKTVSTAPAELTSLQSQVQLLIAERDAERLKAEKAEADATSRTIEKALNDAFGPKLKGSKHIVRAELAEGKLKVIDGKIVKVDGDKTILFDDYVSGVVAENSDLVIVDQRRGVSLPQHSQVDGKPAALSLEQLNKLSPAEIAANMDTIRAQAGLR